MVAEANVLLFWDNKRLVRWTNKIEEISKSINETRYEIPIGFYTQLLEIDTADITSTVKVKSRTFNYFRKEIMIMKLLITVDWLFAGKQ